MSLDRTLDWLTRSLCLPGPSSKLAMLLTRGRHRTLTLAAFFEAVLLPFTKHQAWRSIAVTVCHLRPRMNDICVGIVAEFGKS